MSRAGYRTTACATPERATLVPTWPDAALVAHITREKEIMIKQVSDRVPQGPTCGQSGSIPRDQARHGRPRDELGSTSQTAESPATPVVVLAERRDDVFDRLTECFAAAGFRVARARSSADAVKSYLSARADLLVVNADQPAETAWLTAAKLHLTHPAARIWVYIRRPSTFDVTAANLLAIEELIEYGGKAEGLRTQILDRLGVASDMKVPSSGSPTRIDPVAPAACAVT